MWKTRDVLGYGLGHWSVLWSSYSLMGLFGFQICPHSHLPVTKIYTWIIPLLPSSVSKLGWHLTIFLHWDNRIWLQHWEWELDSATMVFISSSLQINSFQSLIDVWSAHQLLANRWQSNFSVHFQCSFKLTSWPRNISRTVATLTI